ncbi:MAG: thymidine kinase [Clostridia bacterium]|nr:thymidine kinase [Clostridia bacterium]MBN2882694.1 thymidine kinase [Clostridia bacterium]
MAKLYFRYAVMNAGKSTQLLQIAHDYEVNNGEKILALKPASDTKADNCIIARIGGDMLKRKCNFLIQKGEGWLFDEVRKYPETRVVLIDEAQFLSKANVFDCARIVTQLSIPVICFGLKCDFRGEPFEGSTYLFALAQDIEEVTTRAICRRSEKPVKATVNMRLVNGVPVFRGGQLSIEGENNVVYEPVSLKVFMDMFLSDGNKYGHNE